MNVPESILHRAKHLNTFVWSAAEKLQRSFALYSQAESLLLAELGLDKLDLSRSLSFEAPYSDTKEAARIDAEYFAGDPLKGWHSPYPTKPLKKLTIKIESGLTPAASEYSEEDSRDGTPILKVGGLVSKGEISWLGDRTQKDLRSSKTSKGLCGARDVFVLSAGHHVRYIGKSGMLWEAPEGREVCRYVGELIRIQCSDQLLPEFLTVYLNLPPVLRSIQRLVRGMSAHLYPQDLAALKVPVVEKILQNQVARLLEESHNARKESKRLIDEAVRLVEEAMLGQ
ncbi:hypothetical protein D6833_03765 [Candidatus Parcubacteria bacterium]|nr:MAG: hypothetical protein D6833_03765 [Candidatus Parcubacteria bacterium]